MTKSTQLAKKYKDELDIDLPKSIDRDLYFDLFVSEYNLFIMEQLVHTVCSVGKLLSAHPTVDSKSFDFFDHNKIHHYLEYISKTYIVKDKKRISGFIKMIHVIVVEKLKGGEYDRQVREYNENKP